MAVTIYGIKNCDTMKKALKWLTDNGVEFEFHDYKKQSLDQHTLETWVKRVGWADRAVRFSAASFSRR